MIEIAAILQDRYQLKKQLSNNNNSRQTWLAFDLQTKSSVVIKFLSVHPQTEWMDLKLFEREAKVLQNIDHPRIPKYQDSFSIEKEENTDFPWFALVQDYIPGICLKDLLKKEKKLTQKQVYYLAEDILEILIYLHELIPPIFHRDIKPSNIILGEDKKFYLVDFGSVQEKARAEGVTFTVVGTSGYAPPEQLWGKTVASSDLYALGVTLIHLLTGITPADLPQHQMQLQFKDKVNLTSQFSYWLEKLVQAAPEKRFKTARLAFEKLPPYEEEEVENINKNSPNYGCGCLLATLALVIFGSIINGIIVPAIKSSTTKAHEDIGVGYVGSLNRAQESYFVKTDKFTDSFEELQISSNDVTDHYYYQIEVTDEGVFNYAIPKKNNLRSFVGGVFMLPSENNSYSYNNVTIICESFNKESMKLLPPKIENNQPICVDGRLYYNYD